MITDFFTQSIIVQRVTTISNGMGGQTETWATHLTFLGLIDYASGQKQQIASQFADIATHILFCASGKDIEKEDRVYFGNEIYRILHIDSPFNRHTEILLEYVGVDNNV